MKHNILQILTRSEKLEGKTFKKIAFFGCPFDPDERDEAIREKLKTGSKQINKGEPSSSILRILREEIDSNLWAELLSIDVPGWLCPIPSSSDLKDITTERFVKFIDSDGCRSYSRLAGDFIANRIFPDIPCMIGIDHSLTGGAFAKLAELYGSDRISLVVLDSHVDAIPVSILSQAVQYDIETNPYSVHDPNDPFLLNRVDSYNASSFLYHLMRESILDASDLYLIGISDYPTKEAFEIKDNRIQNYVRVYTRLKEKGATILTKKKISSDPFAVKRALRRIKTPYLYVSIDMDIGSRNAVEGVRFRDWKGLGVAQIARIVDSLSEVISNSLQLVGLDIMEINPRRAGNCTPLGKDRTYGVAANLIKRLAFSKTISKAQQQ